MGARNVQTRMFSFPWYRVPYAPFVTSVPPDGPIAALADLEKTHQSWENSRSHNGPSQKRKGETITRLMRPRTKAVSRLIVLHLSGCPPYKNDGDGSSAFLTCSLFPLFYTLLFSLPFPSVSTTCIFPPFSNFPLSLPPPRSR